MKTMNLSFVIAKAKEALESARASRRQDYLGRPDLSESSVEYVVECHKLSVLRSVSNPEIHSGVTCLVYLASHGMQYWITEDPNDWSGQGLRSKMVLEAIENGQSEEDILLLKRYPLCPDYNTWQMAKEYENLFYRFEWQGDLSIEEEDRFETLGRTLKWRIPRY